MAIVEFGEFKGNKMIILKRNEEDRYPFQFGVNKAKLAVECIDQNMAAGPGRASPNIGFRFQNAKGAADGTCRAVTTRGCTASRRG